MLIQVPRHTVKSFPRNETGELAPNLMGQHRLPSPSNGAQVGERSKVSIGSSFAV